MYILFEKDDAIDDSDLMSAYHEVGYYTREDYAEDWESEDPEHRFYRYCPDDD